MTAKEVQHDGQRLFLSRRRDILLLLALFTLVVLLAIVNFSIWRSNRRVILEGSSTITTKEMMQQQHHHHDDDNNNNDNPLVYHQLPDFIKSYVTFHRNSLIQDPDSDGLTLKNNSTKYLLWKCTKRGECGGFGDRVKGMVYALYMAMCTKRVLLIEANDPYPLEEYLNPNFIQWNAKAKVPVSLEVNLIDQENSTMHSNPRLDDQHVGISLRSNLWYPWYLESGVCMTKFWKESSSDPSQYESLWYNLFHMLFKFSLDVNIRSHEQKLRAGLSAQMNGLSSIVNPYIAVHVRTGDTGFTDDHPNIRHGDSNETLQQFLNCSYNIQMGLVAKCTNVSNSSSTTTTSTPQIFVASDSQSVKDQMYQMDPKQVKIYNGIEIFHVDKTPTSSLSNPKDAYMDFWGELKTLVDGQCLVASRSGISEFAERFRKRPHPCVVRFDICGEKHVNRALQGVNCNP